MVKAVTSSIEPKADFPTALCVSRRLVSAGHSSS